MINAAISPQVGLRVSGRFKKRDGYVENLSPRQEEELYAQNQLGVRTSLRFTPDDFRRRSLDGLGQRMAQGQVDRVLHVRTVEREDPDRAPSDGPNMVPLKELEALLAQLADAGRPVLAVVATAGSTATGSFDPLDEIAEHGADAVRFGLLAMSSTQDVRYSDAKVQQGRDLANKLWNASRLILLNARDDVEAGRAALVGNRAATVAFSGRK